MGSLFQRLESLVCNEKSAEENILSEVLAYLLQKNRNIRRRFLNLIFHHHPQLTKHFMGTSIATRVPLNNGLIPDVVFSTTKGCLYVEIKIKSKEKDQSKAYLKAMDKSDRLAFLTPLSHRDIKEKAPRFVGHVRWEDLYKKLCGMKGEVLRDFLAYLEELNMGTKIHISQEDVKSDVFSLIWNCEELTKRLGDQHRDLISKLFKKGKPGGTWPTKIESLNDETLGWAHDYNSQHIVIGLHYSQKKKLLGYVSLTAWTAKLVTIVKRDNDITKKACQLRELGWSIEPEERRYWAINKDIRFKPGAVDFILKSLRDPINSALRELHASRLWTLIAGLKP